MVSYHLKILGCIRFHYYFKILSYIFELYLYITKFPWMVTISHYFIVVYCKLLSLECKNNCFWRKRSNIAPLKYPFVFFLHISTFIIYYNYILSISTSFAIVLIILFSGFSSSPLFVIFLIISMY